jgi:hypothetical protein
VISQTARNAAIRTVAKLFKESCDRNPQAKLIILTASEEQLSKIVNRCPVTIRVLVQS